MNDEPIIVFLIVICVSLALVTGFAMGVGTTKERVKTALVEAKQGKYVVDEKTGVTKFVCNFPLKYVE